MTGEMRGASRQSSRAVRGQTSQFHTQTLSGWGADVSVDAWRRAPAAHSIILHQRQRLCVRHGAGGVRVGAPRSQSPLNDRCLQYAFFVLPPDPGAVRQGHTFQGAEALRPVFNGPYARTERQLGPESASTEQRKRAGQQPAVKSSRPLPACHSGARARAPPPAAANGRPLRLLQRQGGRVVVPRRGVAARGARGGARAVRAPPSLCQAGEPAEHQEAHPAGRQEARGEQEQGLRGAHLHQEGECVMCVWGGQSASRSGGKSL